MAKKGVSGKFIEEWGNLLQGRTPEEQLDLLLPAIRSYESTAVSAKAKAEFLKEVAKDAMVKGRLSSFTASTRRTMGILTWPANKLSGVAARLKAARIRRLVARYLGPQAGAASVLAERKTTWIVNWKLVERGGEPLVEGVRKIVGTKKKPDLKVGQVSKLAKLGKSSKRRATRTAEE